MWVSFPHGCRAAASRRFRARSTTANQHMDMCTYERRHARNPNNKLDRNIGPAGWQCVTSSHWQCGPQYPRRITAAPREYKSSSFENLIARSIARNLPVTTYPCNPAEIMPQRTQALATVFFMCFRMENNILYVTNVFTCLFSKKQKEYTRYDLQYGDLCA